MKSHGALVLVAVLGLGTGTASAGVEKLEPSLRQAINALPGTTLRSVIIQQNRTLQPRDIKNAQAAGIPVYPIHDLIDAYATRLSLARIRQLAASPDVGQISEDRPVRANLDISGAATGAYAVQQAAAGGATGAGVTVAVIDSGIAPHPDLPVGTDRATDPANARSVSPARTGRIAAFVDLVNGRSAPYDDFGHGTHVAGAIGGDGTASGGRLRGMAPGVKLVGVKVLDQNGAGSVSRVIDGITWCVRHRG